MKKVKLIALLLAAVLVLTSFSGTFAFAEEDTADSTVVAGGSDTTETEATAPATPAGEDTSAGDGRVAYTTDDLTPLDVTVPENGLIITAANKAADGREVSVSTFTMQEKVSLPTSTDFVGVGVYNADASAMTLLTPSYSGATFTYFNLSPDQMSLAGTTLYYLEVASISENEIKKLSDGSMSKEELLKWKQDKRGLFKTPDQRVRAMTKYFEDDNVILYADDQLAEMAVFDKKTKQYSFSSPYNYRRVGGASSNETKNQIASMLEVTYYDNSANRKTVYSYTDAVAKTAFAADETEADNIQFKTEPIENGVRFNFAIGTKQVDSLLPYAAEATNFEAKVLAPLQAMADAGDSAAAEGVRKINAYFKRYHYADLSASMKKSLDVKYPGLVEHDLYIARSLYNKEKQTLSDYIKMGGLYNWDDWRNDQAISGYVPEDAVMACFELYVDITIQDGDLVVEMPTEEIKYDYGSFTMAEVTLMRYFGCGLYTDDGYIFVPDGSGSVINFNTEGKKTSLSLIKQVYGDDYSLSTAQSYVNLTQSSYLPVYGIKANNRGYLAILEKGDAMATIQSESGNIQSAYETAYATFVYKTVQKITYADGSKQNGDFTYFNTNTYTDGFRIRFKMLYGDDISYVTMAKTYREYLLSNNMLMPTAAVTNTNAPLVLETLGLIDKTASFFGIVYNKKIPLTSFDAAQSMVEELTGGGVGNISLRYRGWMNGGLNYSVPSKMSIESKLGGKSGLNDLADYMKSMNYTLFPEVDFCVVRRDGLFDGYKSTNDAPKATDRTMITITPRNELDNVLYIYKNYFAISPVSSTKYFKAFFNKYSKLELPSVSLGTEGSMLYSDFRTGENATHRQKAVNILSENVNTYVTKNNINRVMVEGGNAYTYGYTTDIVDIPLCDSNTYITDSAVPFMQIVLHGHVQYAGKAINLSDDITDTILKSAEFGANLHFTLSAENTRELKDTVYSNFYTIDFDTWKSDVLDLYGRFNKVFASLQNQEIENHQQSAEVSGVYITTYANGTRVAVNYNRAEVTVENKTIPAQDFIVL